MDKNELREPENRFCPICGSRVKAGTPLHRCNKRKLKELEAQDEHDIFYSDLEDDRTYDDKLREFEEYFDNSTYYDKEDIE